MQVLTLEDPVTGVLHHFRFCNGVPLNESNPDELVNVLEYWEIHPDGKVQHFSWITDFLLTQRSSGTSCGADEPAGRSRMRPSTP